MSIVEEMDQETQIVMQKVAKILDDSKCSYATHNRKLKELINLRSSSPTQPFFSAFTRAILPLFDFKRRIASTERVIRFIATFAAATSKDLDDASAISAFSESFLRFLLTAASAANKTARFRSCHIISEVIMRLPDDAEVSDELWDEVIESMKLRTGDKVPIVRSFAVRALSRFVNDSENNDILKTFLQALSVEQIADVRKTILLSLPPSNATSQAIIDCTLDVSESVRKAAYFVLANKFPLQSLSIKHRTVILQRGLSDRSPSVIKECLKLMKDEWLVKCCNHDPVELLKYLDVETYELVGESVMEALLKADLIDLGDNLMIDQLKQILCPEAEGQTNASIQLLQPEVALYWRSVCRHLQTKAQAKGSDAAVAMGTEAAVYAAEASSDNDLLEKFLPAAISDYVELVKAHLFAGPNYHFTTRQLLLLGGLLDFSDATNQRIASAFVQDLLHKPLEYELDDEGNKIVIGDGIHLGGDRDWAAAVSGLAKRVHAGAGEFEEVALRVVEELARPCRDRTADFIQWMHCLAVTAFLLENAKSFYWLQGKAIEPAELLHSLLLPGVKHLSLDVQRIAVRCLGLYGLLERKPSEDVVRQLRLCFVEGLSPVSFLAGKALVDLVMWHGPEVVDRAIGQNFTPQNRNSLENPADLSDLNGELNISVLDLLYTAFVRDNWGKAVEFDDNEPVQAMLGEGFAKVLLLSDSYPSIPAYLHSLLLVKLICLYFSNENKELHRLKQSLTVFFEHYPSLSTDHKKYLSIAYVPVMRAMWPGINGSRGGSAAMVSDMRKRAVQASRFMMQMMQAPLYTKASDNSGTDMPESTDGSVENSVEFDHGQEGLAIRIATEVAGFSTKKTAAEKSYISALCQSLVSCQFRSSEQDAIKITRILLQRLAGSALLEKELTKDLKLMAERLKALDRQPDLELSPEQAKLIFGRLDLDFDMNSYDSMEVPPTPATRPTRPTRPRRRVKTDNVSSDEESPISVVPSAVGQSSRRSQRASKTAALSKITATASRMTTLAGDDIDEEEEEEEEEASELTSDESDVSAELN